LAKQHADEMILRHYNHPSIIAWGVGNGHRGFEEKTQEYVKSMYGYIKEINPDRLVN
jgi:beta-galactosidase